MITVRAIGAGEVQIGRKRITKRTEMELAVAVYLCVRAGERLTRDEVIDVFWPGADPAKGRHSLRQMLYKLRLRGFTLDEEADFLHLDRARVDCDVSRALEDSWPEKAEPWMIEDSSEFLPVVTRAISPQFQEWLDSTRSRLAAQYRLAALRQLAQARREGRWADMDRWSRVVLRTDPLNEEATMARAESAAMAGSKAMALEILDQYVEDLGERAGQIALPATVLRRRISERRPEWGGRAAREVPLVGREKLMNQLTELIESAANGSGGAFVLRGAAGIGKTRLSNEARAFAELAGFKSIAVRVSASASTQPLSVALTLIPQLLELRGASGCSPLAMTLLRSATNPQHADTAHTAATTPVEALAWALGALLEALSHECRLVIQLDDLHHCDAQSLQLIGTLASGTGSLRLVWLATTRLNRSIAGTPFRCAPGFITIAVPPLSPEASTFLAHEYAVAHSIARSDVDLHRLAMLSRGNPLFLRELSARKREVDGDAQTPASLRRLIRERLSELSAHEVLVLRLVGILGPHATVSRIRALARAEPMVLADELEQLTQSGIVTLGTSGVIELHECWQTVIFEQLSPAARASLGLECAELLAEGDDSSRPLACARRAAELFLESGDQRRASLLFEEAGDALRARRLLIEAADAYDRSIAALGPEAWAPALAVKLAGVHHAACDFEATLLDCQRVLRGFTRLESADPSAFAHLRALEVDSLWKTGREYHVSLALLASLVQRTEVSTEARHFASLVGLRLLLNDRQSPLEERFLHALRTNESQSAPSPLGQLALLAYYAERGSANEVRDLESSLAQMPIDVLSPTIQCTSLRYRSNALRLVGEYDAALVLGKAGVARATEFGLLEAIDLTARQLAFMAMDCCDLEAASQWLAQSEDAVRSLCIHERTTAQLHATGRLRYQQQRFADCLDTYSHAAEDPTMDILEKRGAVVCATIAAAAAVMQDIELAQRMLAHCLGVIRREPPSGQLDYTTELTFRALAALNRAAEARCVATEYASRRRAHFDRPLALFHTEIRRFVEHGKIAVAIK